MSGRNEQAKESFFHTAFPALFSGAAQAILFNPFDRALYLRVKFRRQHFLDRRNFEQPFQGFMNAAIYRTLVGASYMFWQDSVRIFIDNKAPECFHASQSPRLNAFLIGATAGSVNGAVLNGMQVVKYRMWNAEGNASFLAVAMDVYKENGMRIFFRGIGATALRDCVFGIVYESIRRSTIIKDVFYPYVLLAENEPNFLWGLVASSRCRLAVSSESAPLDTRTNNNNNNNNNNTADIGSGNVALWKQKCGACAFISNLIAALLASVVSSPLNYARTVIYGAPSGSEPMRCTSLLHSFFYQARFVFFRGESFTGAKTIVAESMEKESSAHSSGSSPHPRNRLLGVVQHLRGRVLAHAQRRRRYPVATWRWVNSRLNVGWGSLRVGLGMAVGQSLFHFLQDAL
ncbi:mitochondrial carrier domain-containing protein [Trypanosoma rangeli]|uniref:Mitochondrial carrier domain-containing protein n=1 Tax=Trypanosoma rangeli TaxID=5698 RepID=A0A3R7L681_TRYRA|nr:mitochondrial carrier domain-containing protein [Trypanosoma rangeli]RNF08441.1 mitochondrial carrier domain-containing protein [Trypanosoma rangeli]|eukprot:RNF08441.1 mitochondrial carrier domain-containing protein [Trypanosoma rangeli]